LDEEQATRRLTCPIAALQFAKQFQQRGNQVIATVRQQGSTQQLQDALGGDVTVMQLDVADPASVAAFADTAKGVVDHIDVLINNAGILSLLRTGGTPHDLTI
jgi:NADP-dependent 3-hydroxy acid dehydrogenase YdfG